MKTHESSRLVQNEILEQPADILGGSFFQAARRDQLAPGEMLAVSVKGHAVVLINLADKIFALEDACTHQAVRLSGGFLEEHQLECPRHGAKFDIRSGQALGLPATRRLKTYPVRLQDGMIWVGIP